MIKRLLVAALITGTVAGPMAARAEDISGSILLPNPLAVQAGIGLTEAGSACDPDGPTQGLDGFWVALDGESSVTVTPTTNGDAADLSVWFYDADCGYVSGIDDGGLGAPESGAIADGAAYFIVDMAVGLSAGFDISLT